MLVASSHIIIPVLIPFLHDAGLSAEQAHQARNVACAPVAEMLCKHVACGVSGPAPHAQCQICATLPDEGREEAGTDNAKEANFFLHACPFLLDAHSSIDCLPDQAMAKLGEPKVVLKVRKEDLPLLKETLEPAKSKFKEARALPYRMPSAKLHCPCPTLLLSSVVPRPLECLGAFTRLQM